ncbi:hypothetical protein Ndes2526B_g07110 [Nannochloris sp. 'desiccata']
MSRSKSLEAFKFALYLGIPIGLTAFVVFRPDNLQAIIQNRAYVRYPPEGTRPPNFEELQDILQKEKQQRK